MTVENLAHHGMNFMSWSIANIQDPATVRCSDGVNDAISVLPLWCYSYWCVSKTVLDSFSMSICCSWWVTCDAYRHCLVLYMSWYISPKGRKGLPGGNYAFAALLDIRFTVSIYSGGIHQALISNEWTGFIWIVHCVTVIPLLMTCIGNQFVCAVPFYLCRHIMIKTGLRCNYCQRGDACTQLVSNNIYVRFDMNSCRMAACKRVSIHTWCLCVNLYR